MGDVKYIFELAVRLNASHAKMQKGNFIGQNIDGA